MDAVLFDTTNSKMTFAMITGHIKPPSSVGPISNCGKFLNLEY